MLTRHRITALAFMGLLMTGCGAKSHYVLKEPSRPLSTFQTVEVKPFVVTDTVLAALDEKKRQDLETLTAMIAPKVMEKLAALKVTDSTESAERLILEGTVTSYNPGNQAMRYLVGFGAGSSKMVTEVQFKDANGNSIGTAEFVGGVSAGMFGGDKGGGVNRLADEIANYVVKNKP